MSPLGPAGGPQLVRHRSRVMGSELLVLLVDAAEEHARGAVALLDHLERRWSRFLPDSDISTLNQSPGVAVDVDWSTLELVEQMIAGWIRSAGRYDPSVLPGLLAAGYVASVHDPESRTPCPAAGDGAPWLLLEVELDHARRTVTLPPGLSLDPGGIGKGLAADLAVQALRAEGVPGALVSLGGDLRAEGTPPTADGWVVDVEDPFEPGSTAMVLAIDHGAVCTSSTRSRRWIRDGAEQHHVIDPRTRQVATTDLVAVTVVAATAADAEVRATAALLAGRDAAAAELEDAGLAAVLVSTDGSATTTSSVVDEAPGDGANAEVAA